jgi:hypothetical protein
MTTPEEQVVISQEIKKNVSISDYDKLIADMKKSDTAGWSRLIYDFLRARSDLTTLQKSPSINNAYQQWQRQFSPAQTPSPPPSLPDVKGPRDGDQFPSTRPVGQTPQQSNIPPQQSSVFDQDEKSTVESTYNMWRLGKAFVSTHYPRFKKDIVDIFDPLVRLLQQKNVDKSVIDREMFDLFLPMTLQLAEDIMKNKFNDAWSPQDKSFGEYLTELIIRLDSELDQYAARCSTVQPVQLDNANLDMVAGQDAAKDTLRQAFQHTLMFPRLLPNVPNILLYGPPGTGKTFLVRGVVGEVTQLRFPIQYIAPTPSTIKSKFQGETEQNLRWIYRCALLYAKMMQRQAQIEQLRGQSSVMIKSRALSVLFFDELESLAGSRDNERNQSSESTVTTLLQIMDGIEQEQSKYVRFIAATNYPWKLDTAIQRRFQVEVFVDLSDEKDNEFMISRILAERYSFPNRPEDAKQSAWWEKGELKRDAPFLKNLELFSRSSTPGVTWYNLIKDWAKKLGPVKEARAFREQAKDTKRLWTSVDIGRERAKIVQSKENRESGYWFGYGGSDILNKIMQPAIDRASGRISTAFLKNQSLMYGSKNSGIKCFTNSEQSTYVLCRAATGLADEKGWTEVSNWPDKATVWSCNLTEFDFNEIYEKSRPSYTLTGYMELYLYAKSNRPPNEADD